MGTIIFSAFAILNVIACVAAWVIESKTSIRAIVTFRNTRFYQKPGKIVAAIFGIVPLAIDVLLTMGLISIFNFGGWYAGVLGLFASNLVSIVIISVTSKLSGGII